MKNEEDAREEAPEDAPEEAPAPRTEYGQVQHKLRELSGLSCAQLAESAGLSWSSVSRYESRGGNVRFPSDPTVEEVFRVFSAHPSCAGWLTLKLLKYSSLPAVEEALSAYVAAQRPPRSRKSRR